MKHFILIFLLSPMFCWSQTFFVTQYASDASVKVFVTQYSNDADLMVYITSYKNETYRNNGMWNFTIYKGDTKNRLYFTQYKSQADLIIYFTPYKRYAGWRNDNKKNLIKQ